MTTNRWVTWTTADAYHWIRVPSCHDDKYSRGVLGVITGSDTFPGAAVLSVEAAMRTGVGMVRYLGSEKPASLVLHRRPEVVTVEGRVQGWLVGSGVSREERSPEETAHITRALQHQLPTVVDAGALDLVLAGMSNVVVTPHFRELSVLLGCHGIAATADEIGAAPGEWARRAAESLGVTVLLKGSTTHVVTPSGGCWVIADAPGWLATAGSGDVLGGILGALVATHSTDIVDDPNVLGPLAATAVFVHSAAARNASRGGPIVALDIAASIPLVISEMLRAGDAQ